MNIGTKRPVDLLPLLQGVRDTINTRGFDAATPDHFQKLADELLMCKSSCLDALRQERGTYEAKCKHEEPCAKTVAVPLESGAAKDNPLATRVPCIQCKGAGEIEEALPRLHIIRKRLCPTCQGAKENAEIQCPDCKGTGVLRHPWFGGTLRWDAPKWRAQVLDGRLVLDGNWEFELDLPRQP